MKRFVICSVLACFAVQMTGCVSLSRSDKAMVRELEGYGVREVDYQVKHPGLAGGLNILPGFGNFYLGVGTDESSQWLYGFLNLLTWPLSIVWGVPEAVIDANEINKKEMVYYFTYDPQGKKELEELKARNY